MPRRERRPQECNHSGHRRSAGKLSFEAAARLRAWRSTRRGHAVDGEDPDAAGTRDRSSVFRETEMAGAIRCRRIHAAATWNLYARLVVRPTSLVPGRDPALRPNDWAGGKGTSSRARTPWSRICSTGTASSKKPTSWTRRPCRRSSCRTGMASFRRCPCIPRKRNPVGTERQSSARLLRRRRCFQNRRRQRGLVDVASRAVGTNWTWSESEVIPVHIVLAARVFLQLLARLPEHPRP